MHVHTYTHAQMHTHFLFGLPCSVIDFFVPTAEKLLASDQPSRVLAASLAALAGVLIAEQCFCVT